MRCDSKLNQKIRDNAIYLLPFRGYISLHDKLFNVFLILHCTENRNTLKQNIKGKKNQWMQMLNMMLPTRGMHLGFFLWMQILHFCTFLLRRIATTRLIVHVQPPTKFSKFWFFSSQFAESLEETKGINTINYYLGFSFGQWNLFAGFISELSRVSKKQSTTIMANATWCCFVGGIFWYSSSGFFPVHCDHHPICDVRIFRVCLHFSLFFHLPWNGFSQVHLFKQNSPINSAICFKRFISICWLTEKYHSILKFLYRQRFWLTFQRFRWLRS